ncbi:formate dehydrogenase [Tenacibaculum holothuriorum]|uniref:Sulfur carrier protein FdhD n=1 Tax=Tenacibaculum holothuriorum TaxID=1635173 RepID=A0A1Y2PFB7_9FLAO|nr:formate dehydrogenase accessory sulfurtransferase FdhD [Tenacibaculum holothuriorum]OSY89183.1 formate dehydrogenase [Tenacibaculum holothuriorum]
MQTNSYESLKITDNKKQKISDALVIEAPLQININQEAYTVVMRTPGNDFDLIRGLLYAEDIYKKKDALNFTVVEKKKDHSSIINVTIPSNNLGKGYLNKRTLLSVSSCGICGKHKLDDIELSGDSLENKNKFSQAQIREMFSKMKSKQALFNQSGGSHAAAIFDKYLNLLTIKEDIGRHNAVDKSVGNLLTVNTLQNANIILVSGRVSYEIVSKAFFAKIPIIVAVSACSSLAVDYAKEFGICLIGFSREQKMTIYANPQHIYYE